MQTPIRVVTAASLFDGHDASITLMRRILQDMGAEVIHLGHNRSVLDVVTAVLQEGAQGVAISSYQGGIWSISNTLKTCSMRPVRVMCKFMVAAAA